MLNSLLFLFLPMILLDVVVGLLVEDVVNLCNFLCMMLPISETFSLQR